MAFTEELSDFFDEFSVSVTYVSPEAVESTIDIIFDNETSVVEDNRIGSSYVDIASHGPEALVMTADVSEKGGTLTINGTDYLVVEFDSDGTGLASCQLEKQD